MSDRDGCVNGVGPLISVVMSAYRQPAFLNQAIESVLRQTWSNIEIIVVDDASGADFVEQYRLPPGAKLLIHDRNRATAAVNRNAGIHLSTGKYIAFLDQDDQWVPEKLAWQAAIMERDAAVLLTFGHYCRIDAAGVQKDKQPETPKLQRDLLRQMIHRNIIHCPSQVMMRRTAFDTIGLFDETIRGAADWDMWIRAAAHGAIVQDSRVVTFYREHPDQWSRQGMLITTASVRVMKKTAEWTREQRPDLAGLLRRRCGRWLREMARVQIRTPDQARPAIATLCRALRTWPGDVQAYGLMARALLAASRGKGMKGGVGDVHDP